MSAFRSIPLGSNARRRFLGALAALALCLIADQASAVVVRPASGRQAAVHAFAVAWPPAGYRNINHCGLVQLTQTAAKPRHCFQTASMVQAPEHNRALLTMDGNNWNLKHKLVGSQSGWRQGRLPLWPGALASTLPHLSPGWARHCSIRPPPFVLS